MKFYKSKKLLNIDNNAKTIKGQKFKYLTGILYLAPARTSGFNVCPMASAGCKASCLFTAGRGRFSNVYNGRLNKTLWYYLERQTFLIQFKKEIRFHSKFTNNKKFSPNFLLIAKFQPLFLTL